MENERLGGLDLLRGVAALCVLAFHLNHLFPGIAGPFERAYLAVDFFFMLSGFVLTRTYHERFRKGLRTLAFMRLRLRRLWPTVAIGALIGLISARGDHEAGQLALFFALNLALLPYLAGGVVFPLNGVIWSIFFELVANIFHVAALNRIGKGALLAVACVMGGIMITAAIRLSSFGAGSWDVGSWQGNFVAGLPRVMLSYTIGSLLFLSVGTKPLRAVPAWLAPVLLVGGLAIGSIFAASWQFDVVFVVLICPLILLAGLTSAPRLARIGSLAGALSFPLYADHVPLLAMAKQAGLPWFAGPPLAILVAIVTLALTGRYATIPVGPSRRRQAIPTTV